MNTLLAILTVLLGGLFLFNKDKRKQAEALLDNEKTKQEINKLNESISKNTGTLASEEERRSQIKKESDEKSNKPVSNDELLDFLKRTSSNSDSN